jgi:hypothetical protein
LVKEEIVTTTLATSIYSISSASFVQILSITDMNGLPCVLNDSAYAAVLAENNHSDIYTVERFSPYAVNTPSYNQIQIIPKVDGAFSVISAALPPTLTTATDIINIPEIMTEALLHYVGYRAHGSYDADIKTENNTHYVRFEASCKKLKDLGYAPVTAMYKMDMRDKGYL